MLWLSSGNFNHGKHFKPYHAASAFYFGKTDKALYLHTRHFYCLMTHTGLLKQWLVLILLAFTAICWSACQPKPKPVKKVKPKPQLSFKKVIGIPFTEARRIFDSGLAFEPHGFYQEPNWRFTILSEDSVRIYSPSKKKFVINPIILDHDSVINMAWAWLRVIKLSKDSMVFQVLKVQNKQISHERPFVYMKMYADSYIKDSLHTTAAALQKPDHQDTAIIKHLTELSRADPNKAFAATQPAQFISKSPLVSIVKEQVKPDMATGSVAEEAYYSPVYDITIHKAYDDFDYSFAATVDEKGHIIFIRSLETSLGDPDFEKYAVRNIKGIINGYLSYYVKAIPGQTIGIPHASMMVLNIIGIKD